MHLDSIKENIEDCANLHHPPVIGLRPTWTLFRSKMKIYIFVSIFIILKIDTIINILAKTNFPLSKTKICCLLSYFSFFTLTLVETFMTLCAKKFQICTKIFQNSCKWHKELKIFINGWHCIDQQKLMYARFFIKMYFIRTIV